MDALLGTVRWGCLPVRGPLLWTIALPSGLHQCVFAGVSAWAPSHEIPLLRYLTASWSPPPPLSFAGAFGALDVLPHLSSRMEGNVLALPSILEGVTGLRVTTMCGDSMVLASVNKRGGTVSCSLCLLAGRFLRWSVCLGLHLVMGSLPGLSCVVVDLLGRRDQFLGAVWSLHLPVATALLRSWGSPSLAMFAMRLPAVLPLFCSLVPNHQVSSCMRSACLGASWACPLFHPSSRVGETQLFPRLWSPPSGRCQCGSWTFPFPCSWFPGYLMSWQWFSVSPVLGSQSALHSVFALQDLVRTTSCDIF